MKSIKGDLHCTLFSWGDMFYHCVTSLISLVFDCHFSVMPQPPDPAQLPPKPFNPTPQAPTQGSEFDYQPQFQWLSHFYKSKPV